ncbi:MAG: hypothetical protein V3S80_03900 [Sulfurimonadaceae bacterium]
MAFVPHTQEELKRLNIQTNSTYLIEYANKDYFNGEETIEKGRATAVFAENNIYFNVVDPYGMDKLVMQVRVLARSTE